MSLSNSFANLMHSIRKPFSKRARIYQTLNEFEYTLHTRFNLSEVHYCNFVLDELKLTLTVCFLSGKYFTQTFDYVYTPDMLEQLRNALVSNGYGTLLYYTLEDLPCRIDISIPSHKRKAR